MAEMHPVLWTRVTDQRLSAPNVKVAVLSPFETLLRLADIELTFTPQPTWRSSASSPTTSSRPTASTAISSTSTSFRLGNADIGWAATRASAAAKVRTPAMRVAQADDLRRVRQVRVDL
jgi:nitrate reductase NapA